MSKQTLFALGDSQTTEINAFGVLEYLVGGAQLVDLLRREGLDMRPRGAGIGGERLDQFAARADVVSFYDAPAVVAINGGINDQINGDSDATIQARMQALIKAAKFGVKGGVAGSGITVAGQANLPTVEEPGRRMVVLADTSTTGGVAASHPSLAPTISGDHSGSAIQSVWESRYPFQTGERGWGRIATATTTPDRCDRVIVVGYGYENWTTGGDTPTVPRAATAALRADQQAAVAAENVTVNGRASVVYADVYTLMKNRIIAGLDPDFSTATYDSTKSWHAGTVTGQLHHNAYGHFLVALATRAAFPTAWITELAALAPLALEVYPL